MSYLTLHICKLTNYQDNIHLSCLTAKASFQDTKLTVKYKSTDARCSLHHCNSLLKQLAKEIRDWSQARQKAVVKASTGQQSTKVHQVMQFTVLMPLPQKTAAACSYVEPFNSYHLKQEECISSKHRKYSSRQKPSHMFHNICLCMLRVAEQSMLCQVNSGGVLIANKR